MRILLLSQWFEPEPTFKGLLFAKELAARGHEVEILTGFPNYPGGKLYPGYRIRPWTREHIGAISILRVALYPSHNKSSIGRTLNYASFAVSAVLIGILLARKPHVVYVYHPPVTVGLAATVFGWIRKAPFVYDIQDLWPDTVSVSGMMSSTAAIGLLGKLCQFIYRRACHIVVLSPGFKRQLISRGVPPHKIDVIYNWCDETTIRPTAPDCQLAFKLGLAGRFNVMFAGSMGIAQALDSVLDAAVLCRAALLSNIQFVFIGGGVDRDRLVKRAAELELNNVRFLPRQPMSVMGSMLALADVLLVHLKDDPLFSITIPSKTQAYMAAAKPVLMAVRGDAAQLVIKSGGGVVCEPENPTRIAEAVTFLARITPEQRSHMGESGKSFYDDQLSMKAGVSKFEAIFQACAETGIGVQARA